MTLRQVTVRWLLGCALGSAAFCGNSAYAADATRAEEAYQAAVEAYVYAFPLVLMDATQQVMTVSKIPGLSAPINRFAHVATVPKPADHYGVMPVVDALFSMAWLDLTDEPVVLHVPDTAGRYYVLPLMDAWTNMFTSIGKRTTGTKEARFAITGPGWKGKLPSGMKEVKAPTNMVWIVGQVQTNSPADFPAVHTLQRQLTLTPLSQVGKEEPEPESSSPGGFLNTRKSEPEIPPPMKQVESMDGETFFQMFAKLLIANPPASADEKVVKRLAILGIVPGKELDTSEWDESMKKAMDRAVKAGLNRVRTRPGSSTTRFENGWTLPRNGVGNYGTDYISRAYISQSNLGTLPRQDAISPRSKADDKNRDYTGSHRYVMHFDKGQTPPVNGFWSLTMYNKDLTLVENPIKRYAIGSGTKLTYNEDGSLDLYIQSDPPAGKNKSNWLPAPKKPFHLVMRCFWPKESMLDGSWKVPPVNRVD